MTALGSIAAGSRLTAAMLQGVAPLAAYKTVDQSITSSATTYTNDTQLYIPVVANATYIIQGTIFYEGGTANSSDYDWQFTGTGSMELSVMQWTRAATPAVSMLKVTNTAGNGTNGAGVVLTMTLSGLFTTTSPGTLQYSFKQHTSSTTATYTHANSWIALWQVG